MDADSSIGKRIFDRMSKSDGLVSALMIIGAILVMESLIFIYTIKMGWFGHLPEWIFWISLFAGVLMVITVVLYRKQNPAEIHENNDMAPFLKKINAYLPIENQYVSLALGFFIIIFSFSHYLIGIGTKKIGDGDVILIMFGAFLAIYPSIPGTYSLERDFTLTFLGFLAVFMTILPFLFSFGEENFKYYFLTYPVHHLLTFIGVENRLIPPDIISFPYDGVWGTVIIARACSGIDSFSIFTSSFIAFVLVVYRRIDVRSTLFLVLGISLAYIGNVVRMTIVIASGYLYGHQTMEWVHAYLGYVIFFIWMGFFWFLLYRVLMKTK